METTLKYIASVQMGYSFRVRLEPDPQGDVAVIQMKDLTENHRIDTQGLAIVKMNDFKEQHRVKEYDIVFRSRGQTNTAALLDTDCPTAVIAAPLLRVRVEKKTILPAYLCWFINQPVAQTFLHSQATGTAMRTIGKAALDELVVLIPPLEVQEHIIALAQLSDQEQHLMKVLSSKKQRLMSECLIALAANSH